MTDSRVAGAACVVIERIGAQCSVLGAACEAKERIGTFGGVVAGIASVRWWINRSGRRRKRKPGEGERDEDETARQRRAVHFRASPKGVSTYLSCPTDPPSAGSRGRRSELLG